MSFFIFTIDVNVYKAHINNCKYRSKVVVNLIFMHIILDLQAVYFLISRHIFGAILVHKCQNNGHFDRDNQGGWLVSFLW